MPEGNNVYPSVDFAEASWYGSLRAGIKFSEGFRRIYRLWFLLGIKGSSKVSDDLTAVYRSEHKINAAIANLTDSGHLSYVGQSDRFRVITLGKE